MSGSKINDYGIGDSNIQSVMLTLDKAYKGLHQVSLTNYNNTSASQIAAGSVVENNGALYKFDTNESITGSPSDGTVYIRLVPNGDTITAEYTNTAPTWSDSKQGWYGTGADANKRYLEFSLMLVSTLWIVKRTINKNILNSFDNVVFLDTPIVSGYTFSSGKNIYIPVTFNAVIDKYNQYDAGNFTVLEDGNYEIEGHFRNYLSISTSSFAGEKWARLNARIKKNSSVIKTLPNKTISSVTNNTFERFQAETYFKINLSLSRNDILNFELRYDAGYTTSITLTLYYEDSGFIKIKKINI